MTNYRVGTTPPDPSAADLAATVRVALKWLGPPHMKWSMAATNTRASASVALDALVARCEQLEQNERHMRNLHDWRVRDLENAQRRCEQLERERDEARDELEAALPDDTPELRHWLGSQDVVGSKTTAQIAGFVHAGLAARAALEGSDDA